VKHFLKKGNTADSNTDGIVESETMKTFLMLKVLSGIHLGKWKDFLRRRLIILL